jgi:hypothetical protein
MSIRGAMLKQATQPPIGEAGAIFPVSGAGGGTGSGSDIDFILLEAGNTAFIQLENDLAALLIKENTIEGDIDG